MGTMFCGRHPRIIVQPAIPSLLGTYANVSQTFEWLNGAYEQLYCAGAARYLVPHLRHSSYGGPVGCGEYAESYIGVRP